jgi:hypothetical protein
MPACPRRSSVQQPTRRRVAVGGRFVEVGQQFVSPVADAFRERVEGGQAGTLDDGMERLEARLGLDRSVAR